MNDSFHLANSVVGGFAITPEKIVEEPNVNSVSENAAWHHTTADYFEELRSVLGQLRYDMFDQLAEALMRTYLNGRTVHVFGNGGSASLASHLACDLGKGTADVAVPRFRVVALTDNTSLMTAWANDFGYEHVFSEQLKNWAQPGDLALAISGSGNSPNVLNALRVARETGALAVGLTGCGGGQMKALCDICIVIPSNNMQIIEDVHVSVMHAIFRATRKRMSSTSAQA